MLPQNAAILRIADVLDADWTAWNLLVLKAFIDDSGSDDANEHFVLGGVLSDAATWSEVERLWKECRDRWGIQFFKMSQAHSCTGQFEGWDNSRGGSRDRCVAEFLAIASNDHLRTEGVYIAKANAKAVFAGYPLFDDAQQSPYPLLFLCMCGLLRLKADLWNSAFGSKHPLICVFDRQHGPGRAIQDMEHYLGGFPVDAWENACSVGTVELQVADMLAWAVRRHAQYGAKGRPTRVYEALVATKGGYVTEITREMLGAMNLEGVAKASPTASAWPRSTSKRVPPTEEC